MGDHHDGLTEFANSAPHEVENFRTGFGVEVAGWFIGENDLWLRSECAGHSNTLLLATRQLAGPVLQAAFELDGSDDLVNPGSVAGLAAQHHGKFDVLLGGEGRDEVEGLKDEANVGATKLGQFLVA